MLCRLPQELIDNIAQYAEHVDLLSLSSACKATRRAILPILFKYIKVTCKGDEEKPSESSKPQTVVHPRIDLLLRMIIEEPYLAQRVRSIKLELIGFCGSMRKRRNPTSSKHNGLVELFKLGMAEADCQTTKQWANAIGKNELDVMILLLICLCRDLESLTLKLDFIQENQSLSSLLIHDREKHKHITTTKPRFPRLKSLTLISPTKQDQIRNIPFWLPRDEVREPWDYFFLFNAPALEFLESNLTHSPSWKYLITKRPEQNLYLASIKTLRLHDIKLSSSQFRGVLQHTPQLEDLSYECYLPMNGEALDCEELQFALDTVKATVKHLKISCRHFPNRPGPSEDSEDSGDYDAYSDTDSSSSDDDSSPKTFLSKAKDTLQHLSKYRHSSNRVQPSEGSNNYDSDDSSIDNDPPSKSFLSKAKDTLQQLNPRRLITQSIQQYEEFDGPLINGYCKFKHFSHLTTLHVSIEILFQWDYTTPSVLQDVLPPSLVTLSLRPDFANRRDAEWTASSLERHLGTFFQDGGREIHTPMWRCLEVGNTWWGRCSD